MESKLVWRPSGGFLKWKIPLVSPCSLLLLVPFMVITQLARLLLKRMSFILILGGDNGQPPKDHEKITVTNTAR